MSATTPSATTPNGLPDPAAIDEHTGAKALSLRERVRARERELERSSEHSLLVPIPGMEDLLAVRYRPLAWREHVMLEKRNEKLLDENPAEYLVTVATDKLIHAAERICEADEAGDWHQTEYTLDAHAAREVFGRELPDNVMRRAAVRAIFRDDEALIEHASRMEELRKAARGGVDTQVQGESEARR